MYSALGRNVQTICWVPVVQCVKAIVPLLISCIDNRSIAISGWVLKSPVIVLLSVSSCTFVVNSFLYLGTPMLQHKYLVVGSFFLNKFILYWC